MKAMPQPGECIARRGGREFGTLVISGDRAGLDAGALLAKADPAMYRAKGEHSPLPYFHRSRMDEAARWPDRHAVFVDLPETAIVDM